MRGFVVTPSYTLIIDPLRQPCRAPIRDQPLLRALQYSLCVTARYKKLTVASHIAFVRMNGTTVRSVTRNWCLARTVPLPTPCPTLAGLCPWNNEALIGRKPSPKLREIRPIRIRLQLHRQGREFALPHLAVNSKIRRHIDAAMVHKATRVPIRAQTARCAVAVARGRTRWLIGHGDLRSASRVAYDGCRLWCRQIVDGSDVPQYVPPARAAAFQYAGHMHDGAS